MMDASAGQQWQASPRFRQSCPVSVRFARSYACGVDIDDRIAGLYAAFNRRDIDGLMALLTVDVEWPDGMGGGRLFGRDALRDVWEREWAEIDPRLTVHSVDNRPDGAVAVTAGQVVRDLEGAIVSEGDVVHVFRFRGDLVSRMDFENAP
jgi:ketosteroid isomerase-like protein